MIIQRLDLKAFGRFTDVSLDFSAGPRRFQLVYGPNESGKTTSLRAITSLLFGMEHRSEDNYLHNNNQLRIGGLLLADDGTVVECVRRKGRKATLRDAEDDQPIDEAVLTRMLGGIDRETFLTRFGLSHDELVRGGAAILAGEGDLGEILFAAGAGVGHLREIQSQLSEAHDSLFLARGNRVINQAIKDLEVQRKELRQAQVLPTTFMEVRDRLQVKRDEAHQLEQEIQRATIELARLRAFQQALPLLPQWRSDQKELATLFDAPRLDHAFSERRREADSQRELADKLHATMRDRIAELNEQLRALPVDKAILEHETEIETVFQELAARDKADRDRVELLRVRKNLDRKVIDLLNELSVNVLADENADTSDAVDDAVGRLRVSDSLRARIHELAGQYERLMQQRDDADERLKTLQRKHADVNEQLRSLTTPHDPGSLSAVLDEIGSPASLLEASAEQHEICDRLRRRAEDLRKNLEGCDGDYRQVSRIQIPANALIDQLAAELRQAASSVRDTQTDIRRLQPQRDSLQNRLAEQERNESLPTVQMLQAARDQRDHTIQGLRKHPDEATLESFQTLQHQIEQADQIVDTIRLHHERIHQRSLDQANLLTIAKQISDSESELESAVSQLQDATHQWEAVWHACGVSAHSPERMKRWIADHHQLVVCVEQLESENNRREQLRQRMARSTARLRSALHAVTAPKAVPVGGGYTQGGLFDPPAEDSLESLYDEAVALRAELLQQRSDYDALRRKRDEFAEEIPAAQTRADSCQRAVDQWLTDWQRVTSAFVDPEQSTPSVVVSMLSRIDELNAKKRERDILTSRIRSIGDDDDQYERRIQRLAVALDLGTTEETETGATVRMMFARLQSEKSASGKRASLETEIERAKQRLAEAEAQRDRNNIILGQLCVEAGIDSAEDLPECERRARERARVEASLRDLENQISLLAGDEPIEQFVQAARDQQPSLLTDQIQGKQRELEHARQQLHDWQQTVGAIKHELDLMDGSNRAAELQQSIQFLVGKIDRTAEEYARLKLASMIIRRATEHYRRENQNPVLLEAEQMFAQLTCGEYRALKVDYDAKGKSILFGERAKRSEGAPVDVPVPAMSVGTADALYLALRLASLKHQLRHGHAIPLVIDDCLIQLDDQRAAAAMQILSQLSETTQIILFTHHRHLLDLASSQLEPDDFHLHQL